jgi:hypothetical protein
MEQHLSPQLPILMQQHFAPQLPILMEQHFTLELLNHVTNLFQFPFLPIEILHIQTKTLINNHIDVKK